MGTITQLAVAVCVIMAMFFVSAGMLTDASKVKNQTYENYTSFNKLQDYGNTYQNQTDTVISKIQSSQGQNSGQASPIELLYLTTAAAGLAVSGFFGFLGVAIAFFYDASIFLQIPLFLVTIAVTFITLKFVFGIYAALRGGGKP